MKKLVTPIFVIAYFLVLMTPAVFMFVKASQENTENRKLAEFPAIKTEESINTRFFSELDEYIKDHIGLRLEMVRANTFIHTGIFADSPEESIVVGDNGWLFYQDTVKDYMDIPTVSERNAENAGKTILMMQQYVQSKGGNFTVTIAPNKSTLYPENMPYYYKEGSGKGNLELISEAFIANGVNYTDLVKSFKAQDEVLYQTADSHWNYKGAWLAYNTILKNLGKLPIFDDLSFEQREDWPSDLGVMLYSTSAKPGMQLYPNTEFTYEITSHEKEVDSIKLTTYSENGSGNIVVYRDSFYNTMQIYFAESYENAIFSRAYPYNLGLMDEIAADTVVLEIVERNLPNLCKKAPVMEGPVAKVDIANKIATNITTEVIKTEENDETNKEIAVFICKDGELYNVSATAYERSNSGFTHLYGYYDSDYIGDVYVEYKGTLYQAFPIYEMELLEAEELMDNGFSLYIKEE